MNFDDAVKSIEAQAQIRHYADSDPDARADARAWATREVDSLCKQYAAAHGVTYTHAFDLFKRSQACPHLKSLYALN